MWIFGRLLHTVKPFNLAALKVGDFTRKFISAPFILANSNHTILRQHTMPIKVDILSIFTPFNFTVLFSSRNKGHVNVMVLQYLQFPIQVCFSATVGHLSHRASTRLQTCSHRKGGPTNMAATKCIDSYKTYNESYGTNNGRRSFVLNSS